MHPVRLNRMSGAAGLTVGVSTLRSDHFLIGAFTPFVRSSHESDMILLFTAWLATETLRAGPDAAIALLRGEMGEGCEPVRRLERRALDSENIAAWESLAFFE
jgi:hypothetical protein